MTSAKQYINIDEDIRDADWPKRTDDRILGSDVALKFNPHHDEKGRFSEGSAGLSERQQRAIETHRPCTSEKRVISRNDELDLAKRIGGKAGRDNEAFDVFLKGHVIEVKSIIKGKNDKITMHKDCLERKNWTAKKRGAQPHTVVFDHRSNLVYYAKGVGSFRLSAMEQLGTRRDYGSKLKAKLGGK